MSVDSPRRKGKIGGSCQSSNAFPAEVHVDYDRTLNRSLLARCHRCEWCYAVDDSEFPGRFIFELAYQVCGQEVSLRAIVPQSVVTSDVRGNALFVHRFTEAERPQIWLWFHAQLSWQRERLLRTMADEIELDREARNEATEVTYGELACEQAMARAAQ